MYSIAIDKFCSGVCLSKHFASWFRFWAKVIRCCLLADCRVGELTGLGTALTMLWEFITPSLRKLSAFIWLAKDFSTSGFESKLFNRLGSAKLLWTCSADSSWRG